MSTAIQRSLWISVVVSTVSLVGCEISEDPHLSALRDKFLLVQEPEGSTSISDAKKNLALNPEVTLIGRIGIGEFVPFETNKAKFLMSEIPVDAHDHGTDHDADSCPFCKRKAAQAPRAAVQFVDDRGGVVPIGADKLFKIKKGDVVVVRGKSEFSEELNMFSVTANGIHIRR